MENQTNWWAVLCALFIGVLLCYVAFPREVVVNHDVPGPERIVEKNITIETDLLKDAKADFWKEFSEDSDYWVCGRQEYDLSDISFTVKPSYDIETSKDTKTVTFDARMRFDVEDDKPCYDTLAVEVVYEDGEKPQVDIN